MTNTGEAKEMVEAITPAEFAHLQKVNTEVEQAKVMVNQATLNLTKALAAQQGHFNYLATAHKLGENDSVDFETGQIKRAK